MIDGLAVERLFGKVTVIGLRVFMQMACKRVGCVFGELLRIVAPSHAEDEALLVSERERGLWDVFVRFKGDFDALRPRRSSFRCLATTSLVKGLIVEAGSTEATMIGFGVGVMCARAGVLCGVS